MKDTTYTTSQATYAVLLEEHKDKIGRVDGKLESIFLLEDFDDYLRSELPDDERYDFLDDQDKDKLFDELREYALATLDLDVLDHGDYQEDQDN